MVRKNLLIMLLLTLFVGFAASTASAADNWTAQYYANKTLSGSPVITRTESAINHDWGDDAPLQQLPIDNFSVRWTRNAAFNSGTYRFTATMDDGMRVWVDNNLIIDSWYDSQVHSLSADLFISAGNHDVRVEYYDAGAKAVAKLDWALVSGSGQTSGAWRGLYYNNTSLSGTPILERNDSNINFNWGGSPGTGVTSDLFSVRWTGNLQLDAGTYRFSVTADDGARLWVNNQQLIEAWREQQATTFTGDITVSGGTVPVQLDYFDQGGTAIISLSWTKIGATTPVTPPPTTTITDWRGEYFNNRDLAGSPVLVRNDQNINFTWGSSSPAPNVVSADSFSVRWSRNVNFNAGTYTFTVYADDGVRLWVNGRQLINQWNVQSVRPFSAAITLPGGSIPIVVEYFEYSGQAEARLLWNSGVGTPDPTPSPPTTNPGTGVPTTAQMINANYLNVRTGPGLGFAPFAYLRNGQVVPVVGRDAANYWIKVQLPDGRYGWASHRYLSPNAPFANLPVTP